MNVYARNVFVALIIIIEWFEFSFYLYLGYIFSRYFFPDEQTNGLLLVYFIFFVSYLSRPIGAMIFGFLSDLIGRKKPLILSALLVGVSTMMIGCIPNFHTIGWYAPILLLFFRMVQSLSVSGEFNNSAIYLIENASERKKIASGSIIGFGSSFGMLLGGLTALLIIKFDPGHLAWRYVYIVLGCIGIITSYWRRKLAESDEYQQVIGQGIKIQTPILPVITTQIASILKIICIAGYMAVYIYTLNIYFSSYMVQQGWYSSQFSLLMIIIAQGLTTIAILLFAGTMKIETYKNWFALATLAMAVTAVLFFCLGHYFWVLSVGIVLYALANGLMSTVVFYYMYSMLRIEYRCVITSLCWALPATVLGGASLPVSELLTSYGLENVIVLLVVLFSLVTCVSIAIKNKH